MTQDVIRLSSLLEVMGELELYDITIIGGGPVGLFGAYYAGLRQMKTKIIDSLAELGGQVTALYPEKYIFDVAGLPKISGKELVKNLVEQASQYHPMVCLEERVQNVRKQGDLFIIATQKQQHASKVVILAMGVGAFSPKKLDRVDLEKYEGKSVFYFVKDKSIFKGKRLLIVGGGDSAFDWAMNLQEMAKEITLIHRRDQFRAHEDTIKKVFSSPVKIKLFYELKGIQGKDRIETAVIYDNRTRAEEILSVDMILVNIGFSANLGPIAEWGVPVEKNTIIVNEKMETGVPGIYAAGDVITHGGKLKLIATGFGEIAIAVNQGVHFVNPKLKAFPGHSSEMSPPPLAVKVA